MILDLFAGPGGWDEGLLQLDVADVLGIEKDKWAVATREAAGHATISADVRDLEASDLPEFTGLIASPPCQSFSRAGTGKGAGLLGAVSYAARIVLDGDPVERAIHTTQLNEADPRTSLVLEALRFARDGQPNWLAFEQVPTVLPLWETLADELNERGWIALAVRLNAADYGVPQSRKRAFLLAVRKPGLLVLPEATHAQNPELHDSLFGQPKPWVTMAEALWPDRPRPDTPDQWAWDRPATTVVRTFCPEIIAAPGYRLHGAPPRQKTPGSIRVTHEELCVLQGIRTDYPFAGGASKQLNLTGAILPPPWAAAILHALMSGARDA